MTILGKVLIVFNLLAAGGFAYLAVQDWQGRQTINAAGVRHVIIVHGLPFDDKPLDPKAPKPDDPDAVPFRVPQPGGGETKTVSKQLLDAFFRIAPGNPTDTKRDPDLVSLGGGAVSNQLAEVQRVQGVITGFLDGDKDTSVKLKNLALWTIYQPLTFEEREYVRRLIADADVTGLRKYLLDVKFKAVTDPPAAFTDEKQKAHEAALAQVQALRGELEDLRRGKSTDAEIEAKQKEYDAAFAAALASEVPPIDETERRMRLAHLLMHLDRDSDWQKRVAVVVGLRQHVKAVANQAERFVEMAARVVQRIPQDQEAYLAQERAAMRLAINDTDRANQQADIKRRWTEQAAREADFVGQRTTQLKALQARLAKVKAEVDELLVKQANIEAALFAVQREVAVTLDEVYRLEAALDAREQELLKIAPGN